MLEENPSAPFSSSRARNQRPNQASLTRYRRTYRNGNRASAGKARALFRIQHQQPRCRRTIPAACRPDGDRLFLAKLGAEIHICREWTTQQNALLITVNTTFRRRAQKSLLATRFRTHDNIGDRVTSSTHPPVHIMYSVNMLVRRERSQKLYTLAERKNFFFYFTSTGTRSSFELKSGARRSPTICPKRALRASTSGSG